MNDEGVKNMIIHKTTLNNDIVKLQSLISEKKKYIKVLEKELWKIYHHEWIKINDGDDLCSKHCKHCRLYCLSYLYY